MKKLIVLLWAGLFCSDRTLAQLGANCGDHAHPDILRNRAGIVWFSSEELQKRAIKRVEPVTPSSLAGFHFEGYVSFKILVDQKGEIGCIWDETGNAVFASAANQALQYWTFKPYLVNGKPVEYVGVIKFHVVAN
jgi:hypothetical protein